MDTTLEQLSKDLFKFLRQMDDEADTPFGKRNHGGLAGQSEKNWNDRLAELLIRDKLETHREYPYPKSDERCDIVFKTSDSKMIWLEVKAAWKRWCDSKTGKISERKKSSSYKGYLFGDAHRTHSVAHDIEKLNRLDNEVADYVGSLVIGFDITNELIDSDMEQLIEKNNMREGGWEIYGPEIWPDRNHPDCRYNCWFMGKRLSD